MRPVILHGHIFKNAGTTFDWSLQRNFGERFLDHREDQQMLGAGRAHIEELLTGEQALRAISSHHMTRDLPAMQDVRFLQVYLLRHPLERIRSVYDFERKQPGLTPGAKAARNKSFRDYVQWRMLPDVAHTIRNYQTLYLAGNHTLASDTEIATRHFPAAVAHVRDDALVGLVERYDESMVVLEDSFKEGFPEIDLSYIPQNVSKSKWLNTKRRDPVAKILDELGDLQRTVIDKNSFDLALYQIVAARLDARILQVDAFEQKLVEFRERCCQRSRSPGLVGH